MRVTLPRAQEQFIDEDFKPARSWVQFFRAFWESFGWNPKVPTYVDLVTNTVSAPSTATWDGDLEVYDFATGADNILAVMAKLPNNYREGSDLEFYADWMPSDGNAGNVQLELGYSVSRNGTAMPAETVEAKTEAAPAVINQVTRTTFTAVTGTAFKKDDNLLLKLKREGLHASDTYGGSIYLLAFGAKIQTEGTGHEKAHP